MASTLTERLEAAARTQATKNAPTAPVLLAPTAPTIGGNGSAFTWRGYDPRRDAARTIGNPMENSLLFSALDWQITTFAQAPFCVKTRDSKGTEKTLFTHPLAELIKNPLDGWSRSRFWRATLLSRFFNGEAYWFKIRVDGEVCALQWLDHRSVSPHLNDHTGVVDRYDYRTKHGTIPIPFQDIVVLRDGVDPDQAHRGFSRYRALVKAIATDEETQTYEDIMLHNLGIPGAVISPPPGAGVDDIKDKDADKIAARYVASTSGSERGKPMVFPVPVKLDFPALSPADFGLEHIHDYVESRVSMVMKLPAALLQTLLGIKHMNAKASVRDSERIAWNWNIIPGQDEITEELDTQLLPDLGDPSNEWCAFDRSQIEALREDRDALSKRAVQEFGAGITDRADARGALGYEVREEDIGVFSSKKPSAAPEPENPEQQDDKPDPQKSK